jgi:hypothetical protein
MFLLVQLSNPSGHTDPQKNKNEALTRYLNYVHNAMHQTDLMFFDR